MCSQDRECTRSSILKAFKGWGFGGGLREDLSRIFISFMLMDQNEMCSLNHLFLGVVGANDTDWISAVSPSRVI